MTPLTTLYDEYIDRRKFTEQNKKTRLSIVPPPTKVGRKNYMREQMCQR